MELVDDGIELVRRDAPVLLGVAAVVNLPVFIVTFTGTSGEADVFGERFGAPLFVVAALSLTITAAVAALADQRRRDGIPPTAGDVVPAVLKRFFPLAGAWVVVHVIEAVGLVTLFVFTAVVISASVPVTPIVMLERLGPIEAFRRSWRLTRGSRWQMFAHVLTVVLLTNILAALGLAAVGVAQAVGGVPARLVGSGIVLATSAVTQAIVGASSVAVYRDLRRVREGSELAARVARMAE